MNAQGALTDQQVRELERGIDAIRSGQLGAAQAIAARLLRDAGGSPDAHQLQGMCHALAGDAEQAERSFLRALQAAPEHPLILVNYAAMLRRAGRLDCAIGQLQRAVRAAPGHAKAWVELGSAAIAKGQYRTATDALRRALALQPDSDLAWHLLGNAWRGLDELEEAEHAFRKVVGISPAHRSGWFNLGVVLRLSGRPEEAAECFRRLTAAGIESPELLDAYAGALLDCGDPDGAIRLARKMLASFPAFAPGYATFASLLWEYGPAGLSDDSIVAPFREALKQQPHNDALRLAFARFLLSIHRGDEALSEIAWLRRHGDSPVLVCLQADVLESIGQCEQAGRLYEQLHRSGASPGAPLLNAYARHLLRACKWMRAADVACEATQLDPANQEAWAYLGTAWQLTGDARAAWLCDHERLVGVIDIEPPQVSPCRDGFLEAVRMSLDRLHRARREPVQQSVRGGSQTPGRLFGRKDPTIAALHSSLSRAVEHWVASLPSDPAHPFLRHAGRGMRITGSWSVKLWSAGRHANHIHPEGWISSAFYVSLPPSMHSGSSGPAGWIQFGQPPSELGLDLPAARLVRPEAGKLVLFPSYFWHGTLPFEDEQPRMTVAFDMVPGPGRA